MSLRTRAAATGYVQATGTTSLAATIPAGNEPTSLVVIDHILLSTINGTAGQPLIMSIAGTNVLRKTMADATADFTDLDFDGGFPVWVSTGSDTEPWRSPNVHLPPSYDTTYPVYGGTAGAGELNQGAGMSFTVGGVLYTLYQLGFQMNRVGNPQDTITLTVRTTSITGTVVATSDPIGLAWGDTRTNKLVYFTFPTPLALAAGAKYFIQITRSGARDTANYVTINTTTTSAMASGGAYTLDDTAWSAESATDDLLFKTISSVGIAVALPASSTSSVITATYHYENPGQLRN
jgi:hypothetical protein